MFYDGSLKFDTKVDTKGFNKGTKDITGKMKGLVTAIKAVGIAIAGSFVVKGIKNTISATEELQNAMTGLKSIMDGQGKSFEQAQAFINKYIEDGLVPANNAITAYKNLALRGYNTDQIEKVMNALKDSATYGRQASYTLGEAVQTASEGLKNENSILVDNAGVTKNVAKMWQDYAKSVGKTSATLTQQEKIQAEVSGILEETKFQVGDSATYANTYSGQIARLNQQFLTLKQTLGGAFMTLAQAILPTINTIIEGLTRVAQIFSAVVTAIFGKLIKTNTDIAKTAVKASGGVEDLGNAVEEAGSQAQDALLPFDDLNVLQEDLGSGGSDISVGGVSVEDSDLSGLANLEIDTSSFEDFEDIVNRIKTALDTFFDPFKKAWDSKGKKVVENAEKLFKSLKRLIEDVSGSFEKAFKTENTQQSIENLLDAFSRFESGVRNVIDAFDEAWNSGGRGDELMLNISETIKELTELIDNLAGAFEKFTNNQALVNFFKDAIDWINSFVSVVKGVLKVLNGLATGDWAKVWEGMQDIASSEMKVLTGNMTLMKDGVLVVAEGMGNVLTDTAEETSRGAGRSFAEMEDNIETSVENTNENVTKEFQSMESNTNISTGNINNTATNNFEAMRRNSSLALSGIKNEENRDFSQIQNDIQSKTANAKNSAETNFNQMHGGVGRSMLGMGNDVGSVLNSMQRDIDSSTNGMENSFVDAFWGIYNFIKNPANAVIGVVELMINGIIDAINTMSNALNSIQFTIPDWVPFVRWKLFWWI